MLRISLFAFCTILAGSSASAAGPVVNALTDAEQRGGWELIFDGQSTDGWRNYQQKEVSDGWVVKDGILEWTRKGAGDIITTAQYENFELSLSLLAGCDKDNLLSSSASN